jgi:serine/threonine protein kinase
MLVGSLPFDDEDDDDVKLRRAITKGDVRFIADEWESLSPSARILTIKLLQVNPKSRLTIDQILMHPWLIKHGRQLQDLYDEVVLPDWEGPEDDIFGNPQGLSGEGQLPR